MYEAYWGLSFAPFDERHDDRTFVDTGALQLARTKLRHVASHGQRAAAIVGPPGSGKTCLVLRLFGEFREAGWSCALVENPLRTPGQLFQALWTELGGTGEPEDPIAALAERVRTLNREGRRVLLAVDEAHTITDPALFEHLRLLLNIEVHGQLPLALLLVGQEGLETAFDRHPGLRQRLALTVRLRPMVADASKHYILARLKVAGCTRGIFTRSAAERIVELSQGLPRDINRICELALTVGYAFELKKIRRQVIDAVAEDLGLLPESVPSAPAAAAVQGEDYHIPGMRRVPDVGRIVAAETRAEDILAAVPAPPPPPVREEEVVPGPDGPGLFTAMAGLQDESAPSGAEEDVLASTPAASREDDILAGL